MQIDFGDEDFELTLWDGEPFSPEDEEDYRAFLEMQKAEAYAEFLDAPNCFD